MLKPTLEQIDAIRNSGYRPQVVGCILNNKRILFVFDKEKNIWQLPQGGIDNGEEIESAFFREMSEELGREFVQTFSKEISFVGEDKIEFPQKTQNTRDLKNDAGENVFMKGKKYFFVVTEADEEMLDIAKSEFDDFSFLALKEAKEFCEKMQQKGKRRVTIAVLEKLKSNNLIL